MEPHTTMQIHSCSTARGGRVGHRTAHVVSECRLWNHTPQCKYTAVPQQEKAELAIEQLTWSQTVAYGTTHHHANTQLFHSKRRQSWSYNSSRGLRLSPVEPHTTMQIHGCTTAREGRVGHRTAHVVSDCRLWNHTPLCKYTAVEAVPQQEKAELVTEQLTWSQTVAYGTTHSCTTRED